MPESRPPPAVTMADLSEIGTAFADAERTVTRRAAVPAFIRAVETCPAGSRTS